ncbi:unnamed protein product [Amoebophrya sp. A25]|nr:unnamed protein product [Amoebophrya sp. A25]|eukprot:GSA25T00026025001.1
MASIAIGRSSLLARGSISATPLLVGSGRSASSSFTTENLNSSRLVRGLSTTSSGSFRAGSSPLMMMNHGSFTSSSVSRAFATSAAASKGAPAAKGGGSASKKKTIMTVTSRAGDRVTELMGLEESTGIRISLRQRGCSGMSYVMDFQKDEPKKFDEVIEFVDSSGKAGRVIVDGKAVLFLVGTEMDYVAVEMGSEFVFNNPNKKSSCGCGQSFNV